LRDVPVPAARTTGAHNRYARYAASSVEEAPDVRELGIRLGRQVQHLELAGAGIWHRDFHAADDAAQQVVIVQVRQGAACERPGLVSSAATVLEERARRGRDAILDAP